MKLTHYLNSFTGQKYAAKYSGNFYYQIGDAILCKDGLIEVFGKLPDNPIFRVSNSRLWGQFHVRIQVIDKEYLLWSTSRYFYWLTGKSEYVIYLNKLNLPTNVWLDVLMVGEL